MKKKYRRRRSWGDDEKAMICEQTRVPGVSVSQVARRYDVNANQVFKWLKEPRFAEAVPPDAETEPRFLPVEIIEAGPEEVPTPPADLPTAQLEIELAGGHRLRVNGAYDVDALAALIRRLSS